jgi:ABC-2 type transport system permease protein
MRGPGRARLAATAVAAIAASAALSSCSTSTGVSAGPLQKSISATFANLYVLQQVDQGNPRPAARRLRARAACTKGTPAQAQTGAAADWVCNVTFYVAGPATPVTARYNVNVQTDGCYAADGDGPASVNGSRTVTGPGYQQVLNPLWLIDGCFDIG